MTEQKQEEQLIVNPHNKISKQVTIEDTERILEIAKKMHTFCNEPTGIFKQIIALAHSQVENKNPLRFFVTTAGEIIVNPEIKKHTRHLVKSVEGCASFPENQGIAVDRYNKCEVDYYVLDWEGTLSELKEESLGGLRAKMFQHEIDHLNGKCIF